MHFKLFRDKIHQHLMAAIAGKEVYFTHAKFFGWKFKVTAEKEKEKEYESDI